MKHLKYGLIAVILMLALAACGPAEDNNNNDTNSGGDTGTGQTDPSTGGYPPVNNGGGTGTNDGGYPANTPVPPLPTPLPENYPAAQDEMILQPQLAFDEPLVAGAMSVSGQALPNLVLSVQNVTFGGAVLGTGVSDADGRFTIELSEPLVAPHRIGLTLAELPAGQSFDEISATLYQHRGNAFMNVPNIGVFYETAQVQP
ncbi:MAG TPA: hypothetical protein VLL52_23020 [Anaerolineae bacterium]|nr:hypothetical protein [Anaerolineae bacterium]